MEYICLILQILFLLGTIFLPAKDRYLINCNLNYKNYLIVEIITQGLCIIANIIIIFIIKEVMIYIFAMHIILTSLVLILYSRKGKKIYFEELINIIVENDLMSIDSKKIKNYLLEKYGKVYFVEDIEKCIIHIKNNIKIPT